MILGIHNPARVARGWALRLYLPILVIFVMGYNAAKRRFSHLPLIAVLVFLGVFCLPVWHLEAQTLRPSRKSLDLQNREAARHGFSFIRDRDQLLWFVNSGYLVALKENHSYTLKAVSFPFARPEVQHFVERLAEKYSTACGERLVVTSLTRPSRYQPWNASPRSVHPTGMALDLRRTNNYVCRRWLERVLLDLEDLGILEASKERSPPHYHIAIVPRRYREHREWTPTSESKSSYRVARGDTLYGIASRYRTSVTEVKRLNGLRSSRIYPGQLLAVPSAK